MFHGVTYLCQTVPGYPSASSCRGGLHSQALQKSTWSSLATQAPVAAAIVLPSKSGAPCPITPNLSMADASHDQRARSALRDVCTSSCCRHIPARGPTAAELTATVELPPTAHASAGEGMLEMRSQRPPFAVHGSLAVLVLCGGGGGVCATAMVYAFPTLVALRELTMPGEAVISPQLDSRGLALEGSRLAIGTMHHGMVLLCHLHRSGIEPSDYDAAMQGASCDGGSSSAPRTMAVAVTRLMPPADDDHDTTSATRTLRPGVVVCIASCRRLLAACVNRLGVYIWDAPAGRLLRKVELPSRTHTPFHRNIIVPHSLSHFGFQIALAGTRLALTADVKPGDWTALLDEPAGRQAAARSLLVVQEFGPTWLREHHQVR